MFVCFEQKMSEKGKLRVDIYRGRGERVSREFRSSC